MVGLLFPGQGVQYVEMGKDLYETFPQAKDVFSKADQVLGFNLSDICFEGPIEELTKSKICQPAILTASIAAWEALKTSSRLQITDYNYAVGLSLGEYSALVAAGSISFEDAVYLVHKRGEFMDEASIKNPGRMAAVIGLTKENVSLLCKQANVEPANLNCPDQIVVSGSIEAIDNLKEIAVSLGAKKVIALATSGAFHSSFMQEASDKLKILLDRITINNPVVPVISNFTAVIEDSPDLIRQNLVKQLTGSVLWEDSVRFMIGKGIKNFYEVGPGRVLKGLMRKIDPEVNVINIEKKEDISKLGV
ncbi:MAG: ACP S-malonyltransferase [Candidatus Omnitrophota bacterium]